MRDPQGAVLLEGARIVRRLVAPLQPDHFLYSELAAAMVREGQLVPFSWQDQTTLVAPRIPFVSQPSEWSDAQLHDAALLTLSLADQACARGTELKDASAWNVLFDGTRPVFCDHLSFQRSERKLWWAGGQFARQFVVPLWLSRQRGLHGHRCFQMWRDGVPPEVARSMLGPSRFFSRCWPLVAEARTGSVPSPEAERDADILKFRERLHASLRWMLAGVAPRAGRSHSKDWTAYSAERPQYPADSLDLKRATVRRWLERTSPAGVVDLGCNTGEFTDMALAIGARVLAIDSDHDCVDQLYRRHKNASGLFPVVALLDDLSAGRGWAGTESLGLQQRAVGSFDMVMLLALVHHLAIAASIPIEAVATWAMGWTRRWLVVECIHPDDPQVQFLCAQHQRSALEFGLDRQVQAFAAAGLRVEERVTLAPAGRTLLLLARPE